MKYGNESFLGKRILLVEDNELNAEIAITMLEEAGYYDLILMDIQMPNMDGYALTKNVRESNHPDAKHIVIVAISAYCDEETKERAKPSGIDGFIEKPFKVEEFQQIINNAQRK